MFILVLCPVPGDLLTRLEISEIHGQWLALASSKSEMVS